MRKYYNNIKLIVSNAKHLFFPFLIVIVLLVASTYLNVLAPRILGNSFNALGEYIGASIADKNVNDVINIVNNKEPLTQDDKMQIAQDMHLNDSQKADFLKLDSNSVKSQFKISQVLSDTILLDQNYINTNQKFSQAQINFINQSDLNSQVKYALSQMQGEQLVNISDKTKDFAALKATKHQLFMEFVTKLIIAFVLLGIGMSLYTLLFVKITVKITKNLRNRLFEKITNLSIRFYDMSNTGDLLSRFTNDIDNITYFLNSAFVQMTSSVFMVIGICIMMYIDDTSTYTIFNFTIQKPLFWIILIFGIISIIASSFILKKAQKYVAKQQQKLGSLNGYIDESLSGQKEIITYNMQDQIVNEFEKYNNDYRENSFKGQIYSGLLGPIMMGIGFITLGFMVFTGSELVIQGIFSVGLLITFIQYSQQFSNSLAATVSQYNTVELGMSGADRVQEVLDEKEEIVNCLNPVTTLNTNAPIVFNNVYFEYLKDTPVLKNINFEVTPGKMIAIVGPTGSGKTTIMNLLNRFYDVTSGEILIDNINIKNYDIDVLRKNIGIVLQDSILFKGSIADNIKFGNDNASDEEMYNACKIAKIHDYIINLPDGYNTQITNDSSVFSVGQKQLISIARTILTNPGILVLDEATSNVDTITEAKIQKAMDEVVKNRTSFVIAHRLKTILNADCILVLKNGEIIESGSHQELLKANGYYAQLYNNQFVL